ncbi:MAG: ABC transporter permease [Oscillospiraceae bacterium]|nr:ABC transporter permease [Oscillospiraceae bacterium]
MLRYIIRRLLLMIPTLLGITLIVMLFITITPGDPARMLLGNDATQQEVEELREEMGLNDPFPVRYANYIKNIFQGDFGKSFRTKRPVLTEIMTRYPYSLMLVCFSLVMAIFIGIPIGIYAATHQYSWKDNAAIFASLFCVSMPGFWFALMLIQLLCVKFQLLPPSGVDNWQGWILPALTSALGFAATIARQTRSNLLEVIRQDYITTARAKGQSERKVLYRHALKNAVIPVIMIVGSIFGMAMGGSMISEVIFSIPGLGSYTLAGLNARDYPVIQTSVLFMSALFAIVLLLIDLAFAIIDPRIRSQYARRKRKPAKGGAAT